MSFRHRLALFLVVTLVAVQALAALFIYGYLRHELLERGKRELTAEMSEFRRQLDFFSARVTDNVEILSLDYALRAAVAQHNHDTVLSTLRNHGHRIGAARMLLVGLDGGISADTTAPESRPQAFPFPSLLRASHMQGRGGALATIEGKIYWVVVVPVRAPVPIGFIAACLPVNNALLAKLQSISSVPQTIGLATIGSNGRWNVVVQTAAHLPEMALPTTARPKQSISAVTGADGREYLTVSTPLITAHESAPMVAVADYPLDQVLAVYRAVMTAMLIVLVLALLAALAGAMLIVRDVSRPLEILAAAARRIAAGDYRQPPRLKQRDEVGHLADALINMTHSIAEREAALTGAIESVEAARREAVRANDAKSQFLTNMSHEFRTPLNAIVGFGEMLERQVLGPVGLPRYVDYARDICISGRQLLGLIEHMLDLAEAESGRLSIAHDAIAPGVLLRESVVLLRSFAEKSSVRVSLPADVGAWPRTRGDAAKLRQAFINLIHNAIKFSHRGGEVVITATVERDRLLLRIIDHGIGIDPELLPVVMRPFHRLHSALDGRHQGAGLGLPFAKAVVEVHGGTFALESAPEVGTTVRIELPLMADILRQAA